MAKIRRGRYADFPKAEFTNRHKRAWTLMREHGLDALLVTTKANVRYLTGHCSELWVSTSRPMMAVLPAGGPPVLLAAEVEKDSIRDTSWAEVRTFIGFADEAVTAMADILEELGLKGGKVGVDYGREMYLGLPLTVFETFKRKARGVTFTDGSPALWRLRQIKSKAEIEYIRKACRASDRGMKRAFRALRPGMTERQVHRTIFIETLKAGAEGVPFLPIHTGLENIGKFTMTATDRRIRKGDIVWADPACTVRGYYSDFDRMVVLGKATGEQKDLYRIIHEVTEECVDAVRPGIPISHLVAVRDEIYQRLGFVETAGRAGRMGHASGLEMTEPPSVADFDHTILEPGMVIHLEPKMVRDYGAFILEEVVAVTRAGYEYLTPRAAKRLPEIPVA